MAGSALGLLLLAGAAMAVFGDAHRGYRALAPEVFHPTFFARHAAARERGAAWVRNADAVAREYVGWSRLCPEQAWRALSVEPERVIIAVERRCPYSAYSAATRLEFRLELERSGAIWEVRWAGLRQKCGVNRHPLGAFLLQHNPFRGVAAVWAAPLRLAVDNLANSLNPWMAECL